MRLVIARCQVDYVGRLTAHLPMAPRLLLIKADGSVSIHADDRAYKPLNWMSPPCWLEEAPGVWTVRNKADESLVITIGEVLHDSSHELGVDPGLVKDGVEAHLQELLAAHPTTLGEGYTLVRREYMTAIGPVDLLCRDAAGASVAVEVKRRGEIDGVEQLTRYLELMNRDPLLAPVAGVFAAQQIKPQARTLAQDRGIRCVTVELRRVARHGVRRPAAVLGRGSRGKRCVRSGVFLTTYAGQVTATATTFSSLDPRTGDVVGTYPVHDAAAVEAAVARAVEACAVVGRPRVRRPRPPSPGVEEGAGPRAGPAGAGRSPTRPGSRSTTPGSSWRSRSTTSTGPPGTRRRPSGGGGCGPGS